MEKKEISRRDALRWGAAGAALPAALSVVSSTDSARASADAPAAAAQAALPAAPVPSGWVVKPFPNNQVSLDAGSGGLFTANRDRNLQFLANYPTDNILHLFRQNAGLPAPGSEIGNWDVAAGNLRGHYSGHFMSALALAYAGGNGDVYKTRLDTIVQGMADCQAALTAAAALPTPRVAGQFGAAVNLTGCGTYNTGNSECVSLPAGIVSGLADFTVAVWVNLTALTSNSSIFDFGTSSTSHMYLTASAAGGLPLFGITANGATESVTGTAQLPTGTWTHLAVTLSGGTGTLYVNGAAVATNTSMTLTPSSLGATTANWIGRSQFPMRSVQFLNAAIDEFQIFDRALTGTEVQALTTSADGGLGGGNVAWYRFDEPNGPTAVDSSGKGRDAHIHAPTDGQRHAGFLAAYPETPFIRLEEFATYSPIWAPWYTNHMIMRGLLDAYLYTGNQQALDVVTGMADWAHSRLTKLPRTTLDGMWKIYIAGEYNAMPEVLADLAAITGNTDYLRTAECFVNTYLFDAAVANQDTLNGEHANQHIPQYRGYLAIYDDYTDEVRPSYRGPASNYYTAAANFWDMVVPHRMYADGGQAGTGEIFGARDVIAGTISSSTSNSETCCSYNMLKLTRQLFFHTADPKYMQFFERALFGVYLADRSPNNSNTNPNVVYFLNVYPGAGRGYDNLGTCDGGTAIEQLAKFQDSIYFSSADDSTLYVNLYVASTLNWADKGVTIQQSTDYPADPAGQTSLKISGSATFILKLRVPYWARNGFTVRVNGAEQKLSAAPGTYVSISRAWHSGDTVDVSMPFSVRAERAIDQPQTQALAYGPVPLVTVNASRTYLTYSSLYPQLGLSGDLAGALTATTDPMQFTANGNAVRPFYIEDSTRYHAYMHRSEPEITFGGVDSGVPNYAQGDGTTFLDLVWDQAPFKNGGDFQSAVATLATQWLGAGLLTSAEKDAIISTAAHAKLS